MNNKEKVFSLVGHTPYKSHNHRFGQDIIKPLPKIGSLVDAIGVSQGRSAPAIERPAQLAHDANTTLISICSHKAKIGEVASFLCGMKENKPPASYIVEMPPGYEIPGVEYTAQEAIPPQARKDPTFDLPQKRDVLHLLERMVGNESLLHHDDDLLISLLALKSVAEVAKGRTRAGLRSGGMYDRSTDQHIRCDILDYQLPGLWLYSDKGIGSAQPSDNSSVVNPQKDNEHSPRLIYNEDSIKAHPTMEAGMAGITQKVSYIQDAYDPYASPRRAAQEVFGDLVADGLYDDKRDTDALYSPQYWRAEIDERERKYNWLLENLGARRNEKYLAFTLNDFSLPFSKVKYALDPMPEDQQQKRSDALKAGLTVIETLTGQNFVDYMYAREEDRKRHAKMLSELPKYKSREVGLAHLGLTSYITM